jgi:Fe-S cluster assembly protein SufD
VTTDTATHEEIVDALVNASVDWLAEIRREAWTRYRELPYPQGREEHWRFTDLAVINPESFSLAGSDGGSAITETPKPAAAALELSGVDSAGRVVHADGSTFSIELDSRAASAGVILCDLSTAVREHADLLRPRLGSLIPADDPFRALSLAAHRGGTFLYVPKGVELTSPFQALHWITASAAGQTILPRTVVIIEDGARVVFNDLYASGPLDTPTLAMPITEMFIGDGAQVGWVTWQDWGTGVRHLANVRAQLGRDALLNTLLVTLGGDFSRTWKECTLAGEGGQSFMYGLSFSHGDQRFEHWTLQDHAAPHTTSDLLYKSALADTSQALYYGTIRIRPHAFRCDAYQANRNLALSPHARALPNPQLEIENNDVRCTHGATVGQIDDEQLFYLRSRGIPLEEARRLVVFGFFNQVLDKVTWSGMHDRLAEAIRTKMEVD